MPPIDTLPAMTPAEFADAVLDAWRDAIDDFRVDMEAFLAAESPLIAAFLATNDEKQLEVLAFRARTKLRLHQASSARLLADQFSESIVFSGRLLLALLG